MEKFKMLKKICSVLLLCVEIGILLIITPTVFWKTYYFISPTDYFGRRASGWLSIAIFVIAIGGVVFILKSRFLKSAFLKVAAIWSILMVAAIAIVCIRAAYMMGFP